MSIPHPIGYVELQRSWLKPDEEGRSGGEKIPELRAEMEAEMARTNPDLQYYGMRLENTKDGAGKVHFNFYVGFVPKVASSEPLNPRNLNDADKADQIGDPARDNNIGWKEQKF